MSQQQNGQESGLPPHSTHLTPLDNFRVAAELAKTSSKETERASGKHGKSQFATQNPGTTNLTLNMNFNLQQSTIQMQPVNSGPDIPAHQRIFHSPRQSSGGPMQSMMQQQPPHPQMTPQHPKQLSTIAGRDVTPGKGTGHTSKKTSKLASLNRSEDADHRKLIQASGSPPAYPSGKVKKMKVNKLNPDQLNQIRMHQQQNKAASASLANTPQQYILQHEAHQAQVGRNSTQVPGPAQLHSHQLYAQGPHHQMVMPSSGLSYLDPSQLPQPGPKSRELRGQNTLQKQGLPPASDLSQRRGSPNGYTGNGAQDRSSGLDQSDSRLGRKGERPTVAQILEIGVASTTPDWIDTDGSGKLQQPPQHLRQTGVPGYNSTTSNFESMNGANPLGGLPHTQKPGRNLKAQSNMFFEDVRMAPTPSMKGSINSNNQINLPQFKGVKNSKGHHRDASESRQSSGIQSLYTQDPNGRRKFDVPHDSTSASLHNGSMRSRQNQMQQHYSEGARIPAASQYSQQQQPQMPPQAAIMPILVDLNNRNNGQQQLFSRLQQQFLEQSAVIRHPQMGELPVISMTQQQLNSMIQQAAQHRQHAQFQQQHAAQQSPGHSGGYQPMGPMAPGMPGQPQMAFAIQIQDQVPPAARPRNQMSPIASPLHSADAQAYASPGQYQNSLFLPSLRQQNQMPPLQSPVPPQPAVPMQSPPGSYPGPLMMSQAPIKKMTLCSRGKSVPRSSVRTDTDHGQNLLETLQSHRNHTGPASATNPASMVRPHQFQVAGHPDEQLMMQQRPDGHPVISMGNLTTSYLSPHGANLQPLAHPPGLASDDANNDTNQSQPLLIPLDRNGPRNSMALRAGGDSTMYVGSQGNTSVQSRHQLPGGPGQPQYNHPQAHLMPPDGMNSQRGPSRNLATQSERSSQRAATQGGSNMVLGSFQGGGQGYLPQKGPLSDLIMTQQSNLNVINRQSGSALRKGKRGKSSVTVNTHNEPPGEQRENSSHDIDGGVPYIFENQKINQAIAHEELKARIIPSDMRSQHLVGEFDVRNAAPIQMIQAQSEISQPEFKKGKKTKGRKNLQSSQRDKLLQTQGNKGSVDPVRFGQRQLSQQPPSIPGMAAAAAQQVQQVQQPIGPGSKPDKRKKALPLGPEGFGGGAQFNHEQTVVSPASGGSTAPANLKPNIQLKKPPTQKLSSQQLPQTATNTAPEVTPGQEPTLALHGIFAKTMAPACTKYYKSKNNSRMTPHKYRNGVSTRLLVAKETFLPKRAKLPVLVLNLDGVMGYFDEAKAYQCRERSLTMLQSLSHNFKVVAFSSEPKGLIIRFGKALSEYKTPFAFDAVYQIQRKPTQNQNRVNLTHVILDFSGDDEEDLDLFVASQMVLVTVDYHKLGEQFQSMDLREVFDFDKDYLKGAKAPLVIRLPHARCRPQSNSCFEMLFQLLTCLLVSSKLGNMETTSFFTYNDRTKGLSIPTHDKSIVSIIIPEKMKLIDKTIQQSKSLRFIMAEPQYGLNLHKGFKMLTEVYKGPQKPDWLDFNYRIFKPLLPLRMRLQKITQQTLQGAEPPTGKKLMVRCENEEATRKYQVFAKKNEHVRKHIRKYRARYWAVNQIEDTNLEEENQDIVGDLIDNGLVATTLGELAPPETPPMETATASVMETAPEGGEESVAANDEAEPPLDPEGGDAPAAEGEPKPEADEEEEKQLAGGACSSSSEDSDSDNEHYDEAAQAVKFKVIDIKHVENEGPQVRKQQAPKVVDPNKMVKIEFRKMAKPKYQFLLDFCSKKQNAMLFTTSQQQHLQGAQALQIENNISELVQKLNEQEKAGKKEVVNYDF